MDKSGGLLPINLGPAFTETEEHLMIIHYDIKALHTSLYELQSSFARFKNRLQQKSSSILNDYLRTIETNIQIANEKLQNLQPRKKIVINHRPKRGLINGLGSVVKFFTGNLDDKDRQKYDKIIRKLSRKNSETNIQLNKEHRILTELVQKYNDTITTLNLNNQQIKSQLLSQAMFTTEFNASRMREIASQIIANLNIIINQQRELETSLAFCKLGVTHPSIVPIQTFESELIKIANENHENQIKMFNTTIEYEINSKIICSLNNDQIVYIIRIPVYVNTGLQLYLLQPIPIIKGTEYVTIIPNHKFILVNNNYSIIYSTNKLCYKSNDNAYYCDSELLCKEISNCSQNIIRYNTLTGCMFTKVQINDPFHLIVPESGHIVITAYNEAILEDKKLEGNTLTRINGTWIIQPSTDEILLNNIPIKSNLLTGKLRIPLIPVNEIANLETQPIQLKLKDFSNIPQIDERWTSLPSTKVIMDYDHVHILISPLYVLLGISLLAILCSYVYKRQKEKKAIPPITMQPVSFPFQFMGHPSNSAQHDPRSQ